MTELTETSQERLARYRSLAAHANDMAAKSYSSELRQAYLALAESWTALAQDLKVSIAEGKET